MKRIIFLVITVIGSVAFSNAQISDNITLNVNDLMFLKNRTYDVISINEDTFTDEIGSPQLPVKVISYVLPYNSTVTSITINSVSLENLSGVFYIYPAQPPRYLDGSEPTPFVEPNQTIYGSSMPYPSGTVEIISDNYTYGYHVVTLKVYPIEYIPINKEIYLRNITFTINYTNSFDYSRGTPFERQSLRRAELGKQFVQNIVKNVSDVENCRNQNAQIVTNSRNQAEPTRGGSTSAIDTLVPDYIIITNELLKPTFQH